MRYVEEFRDADAVRRCADAIHAVVTRPWSLMEICGGQTHTIVRFGLDELLPPEIALIHGPGCPVCVTPVAIVDQAVALASRPDVIFCSFGDMLRVPGTERDLLSVKARGGDVRVVYSPLDALALAEQRPDREIVFFAVGFETTAPAHAMAVHQAKSRGVTNFSLLVSHVLVPPAMESILSAPDRRVDGFLAAGHVCTVMGVDEYRPLAAKYRAPIVVTGFEPLDLLQGIAMCLRQLEEGRAEVENQYARSVRDDGNLHARAMVNEVFEIVPREWRGLGSIPSSGLGLRERYAAYDAVKKLGAPETPAPTPTECASGRVLLGLIKPRECPAFGVRCTPDSPLGAPMVSPEGACAAYYRYRREEAS